MRHRARKSWLVIVLLLPTLQDNLCLQSTEALAGGGSNLPLTGSNIP